jgi:hypothetical protein
MEQTRANASAHWDATLARSTLLFSSAFQSDTLQIGLTLSNERAEAIARQRVTGALRMRMLLLYWQLT